MPNCIHSMLVNSHKLILIAEWTSWSNCDSYEVEGEGDTCKREMDSPEGTRPLHILHEIFYQSDTL